LSKRTSLKNL